LLIGRFHHTRQVIRTIAFFISLRADQQWKYAMIAKCRIIRSITAMERVLPNPGGVEKRIFLL
jgi:hypothetical protein